MDRPPPDARKLLGEWMEWERGEATPGRVMANLKTAGLRDVLEALAAQADALKADPGPPEAPAEHVAPAGTAGAAPAWTPTV